MHLVRQGIGMIGSMIVHGLFLFGFVRASQAAPPPSPVATEVEIDLPMPDLHEEKSLEPSEDAPPHKATQAPSSPAQTQGAQARPDSHAAAGRTLTASADPGAANPVADFSMVQGAGPSYVGGTTASDGTSSRAVEGTPVGTSTPKETHATPAPHANQPTADRSTPATPASSDWDCSRLFPADPAAPNAASAVIVVTVRSDGTARSVTVVQDPGHRFGEAARACAMGQRYAPARDREGTPTTATTAPITVRFSR